jgi:hypothetical protein
MSATKPEFATNQDGQLVADAINSHLIYLRDAWKKPVELAIASAYFNPAGFNLLADELEQVGHVRLLLGAQPGVKEAKVRSLADGFPHRAAEMVLRQALAGHFKGIEDDRDLLGFTEEADATAQRLVQWLRVGRVEVRRYEREFLHGKAFLVVTDEEGVLAGSSNFTYAGLALNLELNLGHYQPYVVKQVRDWFDGLWKDATPFDLAAIYEARYLQHNPYLIYLRMLFERYARELEAEAAAETDGHIRLAAFQRDGVWRARRILQQHHGVLVADGVGLGKTFLGGALMKEAVEDRRQRVLLISPATLRDGTWSRFLAREQLYVESISVDELAADKRVNPEATGYQLKFDPNDYAMVVIDEAHAFRNPGTQRAEALRRLLKGWPPKQLVLMTATPVNNSLWDLYYELSYFVRNDSAFSHAGIRSLRDHFRLAVAVDPDDLSPERLFDILDAVAVRRTRRFVKRYYPFDTIRVGDRDIPLTFPKPEVRKVAYDLESVLPGFFEEFAHALDCADGHCQHTEPARSAPTLTLARYVPSKYLEIGATATHELQLAGLLRSGLLKRFESSAKAFALTCNGMAESHKAFLELLDQGFVATGDVLTEWMATDADTLEDLDASARQLLQPVQVYKVNELRQAVVADMQLLVGFADKAEQVKADKDPKVIALIDELSVIAREAHEQAISEADERDKRKVIVFSYYADTVDWLAGYLSNVIENDERLASYRSRLTSLTGSRGSAEDVLFGFAPVSMEAPAGRAADKYDLVTATDVLAEGVNLQQARHIINFDLPWNPMRLVQRHGRIDRIGSPHDRVFIRCFFPDKQLDALLGLEERLQRKISQAAAAIGLEGEVLPGSRIVEVTFAETREELDALRREDPSIFESGGEVSALSGEEYRQELRKALQDPDLGSKVRALSWGSGSGRARVGGSLAYVFCARVGDHPMPQFRYVNMADVSAPKVTSDTLACLAEATCDADTVRVLDEATHKHAYTAWSVARTHIFEQWQLATDPRNLQPTIPRTMREAAAILRDHPPLGFEQETVNRLVDSVEGAYPERIQKMVREAIRAHAEPVDQATAIARVVQDLGLEPSPAPEPLPVIAESDIHLVCWLAIVPEEAPTPQADSVARLQLEHPEVIANPDAIVN